MSGTVLTAREPAHRMLVRLRAGPGRGAWACRASSGPDVGRLAQRRQADGLGRTSGPGGAELPGPPSKIGREAPPCTTAARSWSAATRPASGGSRRPAPRTRCARSPGRPRSSRGTGSAGSSGGGDGPTTGAALARCGAVYLHATGALAVTLARHVMRVASVHLLDELGLVEAIWRVEVHRFPATVTMDAHGVSLHARRAGGERWRRSPALSLCSPSTGLGRASPAVSRIVRVTGASSPSASPSSPPAALASPQPRRTAAARYRAACPHTHRPGTSRGPRATSGPAPRPGA